MLLSRSRAVGICWLLAFEVSALWACQTGREAAAESIRPLTVGETRNVSSFGDRVYFAGQPAEADLQQFRSLGVDTVISLRTQQEMDSLGFDEAAELRAAGMRYVHLPMAGELPSESELDPIFDLLDQATDGGDKVLLHCRSANRVAAVWTAFRRLRKDLPLEEALAEGREIGLTSPQLEQQLRRRLGEP